MKPEINNESKARFNEDAIDRFVKTIKKERYDRMSDKITEINSLLAVQGNIFTSGNYFKALKAINECYAIIQKDCPVFGYSEMQHRVNWLNLFSEAEYEFYYCAPFPVPNYKIRPQYNIGKYYVDFFIPEIGLVIEIDGKQHREHDLKLKDIRRDQFIRTNFGYDVVRFEAIEIYKYFEYRDEDEDYGSYQRSFGYRINQLYDKYYPREQQNIAYNGE